MKLPESHLRREHCGILHEGTFSQLQGMPAASPEAWRSHLIGGNAAVFARKASAHLLLAFAEARKPSLKLGQATEMASLQGDCDIMGPTSARCHRTFLVTREGRNPFHGTEENVCCCSVAKGHTIWAAPMLGCIREHISLWIPIPGVRFTDLKPMHAGHRLHQH